MHAPNTPEPRDVLKDMIVEYLQLKQDFNDQVLSTRSRQRVAPGVNLRQFWKPEQRLSVEALERAFRLYANEHRILEVEVNKLILEVNNTLHEPHGSVQSTEVL